jgi:perosamine synthetase
MIGIAAPVIETEEIIAVNEVLRSGVLAQGPKVAELEKVFAEYCGTKYAVAVSSGTAAIHSALFALGIGEGDEVITTPFSFIATANPIIMLGAKPVFVDIDPVTFNIDVSKIEKLITSKTKAIMPVHLYGQPADMNEINKIAKEHKLKVIEDSCQAVGAKYGNKKVGNLSDMACFSLYATKNIMCGEGGIVTTNNENYVKAIKQFRQHGMSGPYQYEGLGYNYRLTDLQAAIAVEQVKKIDMFSEQRQKNAAHFNANLSIHTGITLPAVSSNRTHVYHQYTLRVSEGRDSFAEDLRAKNIGVGIYYPKPLHLVDHISKLGYKKGDFPETEKACNEVVSLPVHPMLSDENLESIVSAIKEVCSVR